MDRHTYLTEHVWPHISFQKDNNVDSLKSTTISIGEIPLCFRTSDLALDAKLKIYFHAFLSDESPAIEVYLHALRPTCSDSLLWEDFDPEFHFKDDAVIQRDFTAKQISPRKVVALVNPEVDDSFHNLLRWLLPTFLLKKNAFLLHAAGVIDRQGYGHVFFGQSGDGKSTCINLIANKDPDITLLGDDAVIIRMEEQPWVYSAPLGSGYTRKAPNPTRAPLKGLFRLQKNSRNYTVEMSKPQAVAALIASTMYSSMDEQEIDMRFELALKFAHSPCQPKSLHFSMDGEFWPF